jgi:glyoxylase-like metal-dependent hydrolase (beta-lactamase superfamily II)
LESGSSTPAAAEELLAEAVVAPEHEVLDIGCGVATTAIEIARRSGARIVAADISLEMRKRAAVNARAAGVERRVSIEAADICRLPYSDGQFDRVVAEGEKAGMTKASLSAADLRELLEQGRPVTVVDIRAADDREWTIPGSIQVDALDAVKSGMLGPLADLSIHSEPVVTVCSAGATAALATDMLRAQGVAALTLEGGMRAWSLAWNTAETSAGGCQIIQVRRTGKGCLSDIVASDGEAAVIDASLGPEVYLELIEAGGWNLVAVTDTHVHADHLSRSRTLSELSGAQLHLPRQQRVAYGCRELGEGDGIDIGSVELLASQTPGHTRESTTYVLDGAAAFTGDTLLVSGVGRPDLEGASGGSMTNARRLHRSIQRLLELPATTLVLPGHAAEPIPFDGVLLSSTIGELRTALPLLQLSESDSPPP